MITALIFVVCAFRWVVFPAGLTGLPPSLDHRITGVGKDPSDHQVHPLMVKNPEAAAPRLDFLCGTSSKLSHHA